MPNRAKTFDAKCRSFVDHSSGVLQTSHATSLALTNPHLRDVIDTCYDQLREMQPHLLRAATIAHAHPEDEIAKKYFGQLRADWTETAEKLCSAVDDSVDAGTFVKACGQQRIKLTCVHYLSSTVLLVQSG